MTVTTATVVPGAIIYEAATPTSTHPRVSADLGATRHPSSRTLCRCSPLLPSSAAYTHTPRAHSMQLHSFIFCLLTCMSSVSCLPTDREPLVEGKGTGLATGRADQVTPGAGRARAWRINPLLTLLSALGWQR